jgi:hypothetical protein
VTVVKKSIYRNQGRKRKPDFCWILFVMPEDVSIGGNGVRFVIYGMWWNLNLACNIFFQRYYIYSINILLQFSNGKETRLNEPVSPLLRARDKDQRTSFAFVTGKRRGLTNQHRLCYGQDLRNHEQITSKETRIRASPRVCQILLGKSCALPTSKNIC